MEQYFALLRQCPLFQGISPQELSQMLPCLGTRHMQVKKHQMIFRAGDPARWVGLVLSGAVHVIQEDYYGNRSIVSTFQPPQLFGEAFACAGVASLPVSVEAAQDSTLLLLDCQRVGQGFRALLRGEVRVVVVWHGIPPVIFYSHIS